MRYGAFALILLGILSNSISRAQTIDLARGQTPIENVDLSNYIVKTWTTKDGLPVNHINHVHQSKDGYIWIATGGGLVRFDGISFVTYTSQNTEGIESSYISKIAEGTNGDLWLGLRNEDSVRLSNGLFETIQSGECVVSGRIYTDEKKAIWLYASSRISQFIDGQCIVHSVNNPAVPRDVLENLFPVSERPAYFITHENVVMVVNNDSAYQATGLDNVVSGKTLFVSTRQANVLWFKTQNGPLYQFKNDILTRISDRKVNSGSAIVIFGEDNSGISWALDSEGFVYRYNDSDFQLVVRARERWSVGEDGSIWVGSRHGAGYELSDGKILKYDISSYLNGSIVTGIIRDMEGSIWLGTDAGLFQLVPKSIQTFGSKDGLLEDFIRPIRQLNDGSIWIGTWGKGIHRMINGVIEPLVGSETLPSPYVWSIFQSTDGRVWVGTNDGGLSYLDQQTNRFVNVFDGTVRAISEDSVGTIWFGVTNDEKGFESGLFYFSNGEVFDYFLSDNPSQKHIWAIYNDQSGRFWIATEGGVAVIREGKVQFFTTTDGLSNNFAVSFFEDSEGSLWVSTHSAGLNRYKDGRFTSVSSKQGLFADGVWQTLRDEYNSVWMSSDKGVFRVSESDLIAVADGERDVLRTISFTEADGMLSAECNRAQPAGWKDRDGILWFPTIAGLVRIDPSESVTNRTKPGINVWNIKVDGVDVERRLLTDLTPGSKNLLFQFSVLSFRAPHNNQFRYRLEGFDDRWHEGGGIGVAKYTNVPPGKYVFRVFGANNNGVWSELDDAVLISFGPYYYNSWWFFTAIGGVILGLLIMAFQYKMKLVKEEAATLTRQNIAMDLHDDIGSRIATIALCMELAVRAQEAGNENGTSLGSLLQRVRQLSIDFRDSMWVIHSEEDHIVDLVQQMRTVAERMIPDMRYSFKIQGFNLKESIEMGTRRHIYLMFKEVIHNAVKHSKSKTIDILVEFKSPQFSFRVTDYGVGFDPENRTGGNGIKNIRRRSVEIGGDLSIASTNGTGTTVSLTVELP